MRRTRRHGTPRGSLWQPFPTGTGSWRSTPTGRASWVCPTRSRLHHRLDARNCAGSWSRRLSCGTDGSTTSRGPHRSGRSSSAQKNSGCAPKGIRTPDLHLERVASWASRRWGPDAECSKEPAGRPHGETGRRAGIAESAPDPGRRSKSPSRGKPENRGNATSGGRFSDVPASNCRQGAGRLSWRHTPTSSDRIAGRNVGSMCVPARYRPLSDRRTQG